MKTHAIAFRHKSHLNLLGAISLSLVLNFILSIQLFAQTLKGQEIHGEYPGDQSGNSISMPDGNTIAIGAPSNVPATVVCGHVRVYTYNGSAWVQKGTDIDGLQNEAFGTNVSMPDANTLAVGAPYAAGVSSATGAVRVYAWNGSAWVQKGTDIEGTDTGDYLGYRVSMPDPNTVGVSAPYHDGSANNTGLVKVFRWNGSAWVQKGLALEGTVASDILGESLSMADSNTVAVGIPQKDPSGMLNAGAVQVYTWNGSAWVQKGADIDGAVQYGQFGDAVSMPDPNTVAIGGSNSGEVFSNGGIAKVYRWNGSAWVMKGSMIPPQASANSFGHRLEMADSNHLAVGALNADSLAFNGGQLRTYFWDGQNWQKFGQDINGDTTGSHLGLSVAMPDIYTVGVSAFHMANAPMNMAGMVLVYDVSPPVSVPAPAQAALMRIFPNPVQDVLTIELDKPLAQAQIELIDVMGRIVLTEAWGTQTSQSLDLHKLPAGLYTLIIKQGQKVLTQDKVLKY